MHVHRFEKLWIGLSLFLIAAFIGIVLFGFVALDLKVPGVEVGEQVDPTTVRRGPSPSPACTRSATTTTRST